MSFNHRVWDGMQMLDCGVDSNGCPIKFSEHLDAWLPIDEHPECKSKTALDDTDVMMSTGLKDKNGVQIYEGDLLHFSKADEIEHIPDGVEGDGTKYKGFDCVDKYYGEVVWYEDSAGFGLNNTGAVVTYVPNGTPMKEAYWWLDSCNLDDAIEAGAIVAGNIYETPNLRHLKEDE